MNPPGTPVDSSILRSITNMSVRQIAKDMGLTVEERPVALDELRIVIVEKRLQGHVAVLALADVETSGNEVYAMVLGKIHHAIRQGDTFANPLKQTKKVDSIVVNMIDVGEETGDMDKMLEKIANNFDDEADVLVSGLMSLLEPIMIVALGLMVGTIVIAMFLPMVKIMEVLM